MLNNIAEAVLKITKITLIVGMAAYMGLTGSLFLACAVAAIIGLRAKEWKELKLLFIFWIIFEGLTLVGSLIVAATLPVDILVENIVCYGIGLTLLVLSAFKQQKRA